MTTILIPTYRTSTLPQDQTIWGDLRMALMSIATYAPEAEVIVAWDGSHAPAQLPDNPRMRLLERPKTITTSCEGWNWCVEQTDDDDLVIMNDDAVLHPDSLRLLMEDVALLRAHPDGIRVGMVGMRSNFIKGPQNVREPNGGELRGMNYTSEATILEVEVAVPVVAYVSRSAFQQVGGFPATNWFGDDLLCWDMKRQGFRHFVSRAYCHHVGQRGTGQHKSSEDLLREGMAWLAANRPDYLNALSRA